MNKLEKCVWKDISDIQRKEEVNRGQGTKGTENYYHVGCYVCSGYNIKCEKYKKRIRGVETW